VTTEAVSSRPCAEIGDNEANLAVAEIIGRKGRHGLGRPGAQSFRVPDQIVQALRRQVFGRILRHVEVKADIGGASSVQLVAGEALNHEQRLPCANGTGRGQRRIDGERRPARCRRRLAHQLRHLERPLLAALPTSAPVHTM
jgi:hypothetical protein